MIGTWTNDGSGGSAPDELAHASSLPDGRATWKHICYKNATMEALSESDL